MLITEYERKRLGLPEPVWTGPSMSALRAMESQIERLRCSETEFVEARERWLSKDDESSAELERRALDDVRAETMVLADALARYAARAAAEGLVILDEGSFARPIARHGEYLRLEPQNVIGRLTGERWRGVELCEWVDPTYETITQSWDVIVAREPAQVTAPDREPEIPIIAYRERESRAEAGVILRHEYRVRSCEDIGEDALAQALGRDWRHYRGNATHVLEERTYRDGEPQTVWTTTASFDGYERAVEHLDSGVTFVCPILREVHEGQEREQQARAAARAEQAERERIEALAEKARRGRAERSAAAFDRLSKSKDGHVAERWNTFTKSATPEHVERLRADARAVELHDAVIAAETVPAKRRAIKAFLAHVGCDPLTHG